MVAELEQMEERVKNKILVIYSLDHHEELQIFGKQVA